MRKNLLKAILRTGVRAATVLLFGAGVASAQSVPSVDLTAQESSVLLPDGASVPMWTYSCGTATAGVTCSPLNPGSGGWSPVVITVAASAVGPTNLNINLTNNLPG